MLLCTKSSTVMCLDRNHISLLMKPKAKLNFSQNHKNGKG